MTQTPPPKKVVPPTPSIAVDVDVFGVSGGKVTLALNGGETLSATAEGTIAFTTLLLPGDAYTVSVTASPDGEVCSVRSATGSAAAPAVTVSVHCVAPATPVFNADASWSSYVDRANPGAACDDFSSRSYYSCIHLGEKRQVIVPGLSDCSAVTFSDALGVFAWSCSASTDALVFQSHEVLPGKGLRDLIDFANVAWLPESLLVHTAQGDVVSPATAWWTNPISLPVLPSDPTTMLVPAVDSGTVYLVDSSNAGAAYELANNNVSLVSAPGVAIHPPIAFTGDVINGEAFFDWIEVDVNGNGAGGAANQGALGLYPAHFNVLNGAHLQNTTSTVFKWDSYRSWLIRSSVLASAPTGIVCEESCYSNTFRDVSFENLGTAIDFSTAPSAFDNVFYRTTFMNTQGTAVKLSGVAPADPNASNVFIGTTFAFSDGDGLLSVNVPIATMLNTTSVGNLSLGIENTPSESLVLENFLALANGAAAVTESSALRLNQFILAYNDGGGAQFNASGATVQGSVQISTTANLASPNLFTGQGPSVDHDSLTTFASGPSGPLLPGQGYGPYSNGGLVSEAACFSGSPCAFWDFALLASSTAALAVNPAPVDTLVAHEWTPFTADDCTAFPGTSGDGSYCKTVYLSFAVEIFGDDIGNDNGLCESNEACILSPNIGAYQGEGDLQLVDPAFATGAFSGITLYQYSVNGR